MEISRLQHVLLVLAEHATKMPLYMFPVILNQSHNTNTQLLGFVMNCINVIDTEYHPEQPFTSLIDDLLYVAVASGQRRSQLYPGIPAYEYSHPIGLRACTYIVKGGTEELRVRLDGLLKVPDCYYHSVDTLWLHSTSVHQQMDQRRLISSASLIIFSISSLTVTTLSITATASDPGRLLSISSSTPSSVISSPVRSGISGESLSITLSSRNSHWSTGAESLSPMTLCSSSGFGGARQRSLYLGSVGSASAMDCLWRSEIGHSLVAMKAVPR